MTGQKPLILIKNASLRGIKKKKVMGLSLTLRSFEQFLNFFIFRQLSLIPFFKSFSLKNTTTKVSFIIKQKTQDDDLISQLLKIDGAFPYRIMIQTTTSKLIYLQTLLINYKIPIQLK